MRLTMYSDYAMRVLMYLALRRPELCTIQEIADAYGISKNHLMKVAYQLGLSGWIETVRGRGGGLRLARDPAEVRLGDVVRVTEEDFRLVECFDPDSDTCRITPACRLQGVLREAGRAFIDVLDGYTLADLVDRPRALARLLDIPAVGGRRSAR
ncbi:MAG: Rrf2 family transcriptional regulator [Minwuiales bacterium]|nr:Rrf2 family transcriptional regulator [Minwuiales bacterium]